MTDNFSDPASARDYLCISGALPDQNIDLFECALALAAVHRPSVVIDKYRQHFQKICDDLRVEFDALCAKNNGDSATVQAESLRAVMTRDNGYAGDVVDYDNLQNVDLMRVIDRRLGMPITLSILAVSACRSMGWDADGLNFPGHFIMRLEKDGERLIVDPFQGCKVLQASDLRQILKSNVGEEAELSGDYYEPCTARETLLRLQNNIKFRLIDTEHYQEALEIVDLMTLVAPDDYRLDLDMAVLLSRLERPRAAVEHIGRYIEKTSDDEEKAEAEAFLLELKSILH
ncbi:MAG: hypothetical protein COB76_01940 [Alphaproteobacteria bacterium]|nr:MAG: hypothetical protein COB76_01940 [Alphaproteobacteria bacterium]